MASTLVSMSTLICLCSSSILILEKTATEEHSEYFIGIYFLLELTMAEAATASSRRLLITWFLSGLIVNPALGCIGKARVSSANFFESISCLRRSIFIRVQLNSVLFIRLLDIVFGRITSHSQNVIVILFCQYFSAYFDLCSRVLRSRRLLRLSRL